MVLNNVQENFTRLDSISPGKPVNVMEPLKRRRTSMAPTLVFDRNGKRLRLAVGAAGGGAIPDHVTQTVLGVTTYKTDPQAAINHGHYSGQTITSNCAGVIGARSELERDTDHLSSTIPAHARARLGNIAIDLSARAGRWHRFVGS